MVVVDRNSLNKFHVKEDLVSDVLITTWEPLCWWGLDSASQPRVCFSYFKLEFIMGEVWAGEMCLEVPQEY